MNFLSAIFSKLTPFKPLLFIVAILALSVVVKSGINYMKYVKEQETIAAEERANYRKALAEQEQLKKELIRISKELEYKDQELNSMKKFYTDQLNIQKKVNDSLQKIKTKISDNKTKITKIVADQQSMDQPTTELYEATITSLWDIYCEVEKCATHS